MSTTSLRGVDRAGLGEVTVRVIRPAARARPEVRHIRLVDGEYVVKDFAVNGTPFKRVLGAYLVWRERLALARATGIEGVQRLAGQLGPCALVTEYIEGLEATAAPPERLTEEFFDKLARVIADLHARGVVHADLKKLENIMVTPEGDPVLVDFTSAFLSGSNPLTALLFPWLCDDDLRAVCKLKKRCAPHLLTEREALLLEERSWIETAFRWSRRYTRYIVKLFSTPEQDRASVRLK